MTIGLWSRAAFMGAAALTFSWYAGDAAAQAVTPPPALLAQTPQPAQPMPQPAPPIKILDEAKVGLLDHDVGFLGHHKERGEDVNLEMLFASPNFLHWIWSPRPHLGADINGSGATSNYYAGLTWGGVFWRPGWSRGDGFFAYFSEGGSVNDGKILTTDPHRKSLGSHELFKEGLDLGYQLNDVINVSAFIDHISNAGLASKNEGITNIGMRVGYKF